MASSILLSDNGVSSGSAGLKETGGNDGTLLLQTTTSGGTATTALAIDTSQNVGIGTSSMGAPLSFADTNALKIQFNGNAANFYGISKLAGGGSLGDGEFRLTSGNTSGGGFTFSSGGTERVRIDSSGNLLVGTTTQSYGEKLKVYSNSSVGNAAFFWQDNSADRDAVVVRNERASGATSATMISFMNANGSLSGKITSTGSATAYVTSSDYRLKENIAPMTGALDAVAQLKPCTYTWKDGGFSGQGFIAHELSDVVPECVVGEKDATRIEQYEISPAVPATFDEEGNELTPAVEAVMGEREVPVYQGIDTSFLVATLTAAIQEQQALITQLRADVEALKAA